MMAVAGKGPLRVAVDARVLGQRGVGRYLSNLLRALAGTRASFEARLYLGRSSDRAAVPRDPRFSVEELRSTHPAWAEQVLIPRRARAWGAHVLHYPDNSGALWPGLPMVLTQHDTMWRRPLAEAIARPTLRQRLQDAYRKAVCPRAARAAAVVLTVSRHSAACLERETGLHPSRLRVVVEGADPVFQQRLPAAEARWRAVALGLPGPFVLCSGAADRRKNIDRLIQAFALARRGRGPLQGARLAVTSLRPGEAATTTYRATAKRHQVGDRVSFLPYVSDADLKALYQRCLCYAFPSEWEGFGLPLLEAYAMGAAVLASSATALPEIGGGGAVYADPFSVEGLAVGLRAAASPAGRPRRRAAAARQLRAYRWDRSARQHLEAYRAAIQGAEGRGH